jgi:hypothetical protein
MLSYHMVIPHQKKGSRLKPKDLFTLPSDGIGKINQHVSKVYKLSPEEIKQWHSGTWKPKEEMNG